MTEERKALDKALQVMEERAAKYDEPAAWGMPNSRGEILDIITPSEHARMEGGYTVPLYKHPPREWVGQERMTRDDIIRMAREAGLIHYYDSEGQWSGITNEPLFEQEKNRNDNRLFEILAPFAALVAAAERERIKAANAPEIERANEHIAALYKQIERTEKMADDQYRMGMEAEREACARICDSSIHDTYIEGYTGAKHSARRECAAAIRARGQKT